MCMYYVGSLIARGTSLSVVHPGPSRNHHLLLNFLILLPPYPLPLPPSSSLQVVVPAGGEAEAAGDGSGASSHEGVVRPQRGCDGTVRVARMTPGGHGKWRRAGRLCYSHVVRMIQETEEELECIVGSHPFNCCPPAVPLMAQGQLALGTRWLILWLNSRTKEPDARAEHDDSR